VTGTPDAEKRVDKVIAEARDNIRKARRSGVILSFMAGAAALAGAAVAWFAVKNPSGGGLLENLLYVSACITA
jgi:hypothetical protein